MSKLSDESLSPNTHGSNRNATNLTHNEVRKTISEGLEVQISALKESHPGKRLFELSFFPSLYALGTLIIVVGTSNPPSLWNYLVWGFGSIIAALALNSIVLLLHEGMHCTLLVNERINRWVSILLGSMVLMSFTAYQVMHLRHHKYLGDPRDPDDYHNYTSSQIVVWIMHFTRLVLGSLLYIFLIPIFAIKYGSSTERRRIFAEYALLLSFYASLLLALPGYILFWAWVAPLIIVGFMTSIRGFTQHGLTDAHDPYLASRSIYPNRVITFFLLNENLHLEHHLFPEIPSYNLPAVNALISDRLTRKVAGKSYLAFLGEFFKRTLNMDESPFGLTSIQTDSVQNKRN